VVAAELIAAQKGLGSMVMEAATFYRLTDVYVGIALIGLIGFLLTGAIGFLERRLIHWSGMS
jgi:NitT/TauT family transport system permease protein